MKLVSGEAKLRGEVEIPGSKSHTIRALAFGLLAEGESEIKKPLDSADTLSCVDMIRQMGASVSQEPGLWRVRGLGRNIPVPGDVIHVGNSGTTLYIGLGIASLIEGYTVFTGDGQIRNRTASALISSINELGGEAWSTRGNGKPPVIVKGKLKGGKTSIEAVTSQYITSMLIALPLLDNHTTVEVPLLHEKPYVSMTLAWLDRLGIEYENRDYSEFFIKGGQEYRAFSEHIPADFSSATFFLVAAAITGSELTLQGLDFRDTQGDKEVVNILEKMGAEVDIGETSIKIKGGGLRGGSFDLNAIPDSLPALAVAACFAEGETRLVNVPQARIKETDRISVMCRELKKLGAHIEEEEDGLVIRRSDLRGCEVDGHGDHRVVMALAVAGLGSKGEITISTAESVSITFPNFADLMNRAGAKIRKIEEKQ
jgi:3-phosphoshikimate 1-carboxyvinyltransferase